MDNSSIVLKAGLLENGINVSSQVKEILDKKSDIWWLRNDYVTAAGITLNFNDEYVTCRQNPNSKYILLEDKEKIFILDEKDNSTIAKVIIPPDYMKENIIIDGKIINDYVTTSTDRIRLLLMTGCANHCKFCNGPVEFEYGLNKVESIDKAYKIAIKDQPPRHGHISISNVKTKEELIKLTLSFEFFGRKYPGFFDLMTTPRGFTSYTDSSQYKAYLEHTKDIGICGVAANMELNNPDQLRYWCPEKAIIGQKKYLKFIEYAVEIFGVNKVRSLLIVGIEPLEETLNGVKKLVERGCNPVLSPLYPYGEANMKPSAKLLVEARLRSQEICDKYGIALGPICKPCSHNTL